MTSVRHAGFALQTMVPLVMIGLAGLGPGSITWAQEPVRLDGRASASSWQFPSPGSTGGDAVEVAGFGELGLVWPSASESVRTILGRDRLQAWGGGLRLASVEGPYIEVSVSRIRETGSQVFVFEGEVFDLGIPTEITQIPLDFTIGYRVVGAPQPGSAVRPVRRLVPYFGGGIGRLWYRESSAFADDLTEATTSYHAAGGVEVRVTRWVTGLVELRYRWAPGILGEGGVSAEFDDDDLGGPSLAFRVAIGR